MLKKVMKVIEYEAGQERSAIKDIIEKSIQEGWDIIKLTVTVVNGYNIRPSAELQIRLAYIRSLRAGQHGDVTTRNFWNQVDAKMADVRKSLTATTCARFYSECLAWDQGKWPVQQSSRDSLRDVETLATGV
ncbi:hypothetical protein BT69DRAFT_1315484 [Atractiella rhizophila]|nr:hypothetical protein BT69DRAFT_1315484 [Atractiella rhizophila]